MNPVPLKKDKINPSERVNIEMTHDYDYYLAERIKKLGLKKVQWLEVAEWLLSKNDFKGLYYTDNEKMLPKKLTRATRLRVSELANYKWYYIK